MAGRPKEPIDLILAKGKKHLTLSEIEERKSSEIKVNQVNVKPPKYLSKKQKEKFEKTANILLDIGIITELDEDCLARYLIAQDNYEKFTELLDSEFRKQSKEIDVLKLEKINRNIDLYLIYQDRALKQCRACASDLGLSISSRCKLIMPNQKEPPKENKFSKFKVI